MGAKETDGQLSHWNWGYCGSALFWCHFLPKMLQNQGVLRSFSWCQEIWFQNPPKTNFQFKVLTSSSWSPTPPPGKINFRHPVGVLKSCPRVFARTWGYSFFFLAKMTLPAIHMSSTMIQRDHAARGLSRRCSKLAPRLDEVKELTRDQAVRHGWLSTDFGWRSYTSSTKCQVPHLIFWPCRRWQ